MDTKTAPPKLLHIFKPGRHVTAAGEEIEFSVADIEAMARVFDPKLGKAPIVIGHPKTDDPAQGWAKRLYVTPKGLYAEPEKVDPQFAASVNAGRYGGVSPKFFRPTDPNNPVPGSWYLRHIGMLGAANPAVPGLDDPEFAKGDDEGVCFNNPVEFSGWADTQVASIFRRLRDWIIGKDGLDEADKIIPDYAIASLENEARNETAEDLATPVAFSTHQPQENTVDTKEADALRSKNAELENQLKALQAKSQQDELAKRHAANVEFAAGLTGKLKPEQRDVIVATLDTLDAMDSPVEFSSGDSKQPLVDAFKGLFEGLPDLVQFNAVATKNRAAGSGGESVEFAAPAGCAVDESRMALHRKALAHAEANGVSYEAALAAVSR